MPLAQLASKISSGKNAHHSRLTHSNLILQNCRMHCFIEFCRFSSAFVRLQHEVQKPRNKNCQGGKCMRWHYARDIQSVWFFIPCRTQVFRCNMLNFSLCICKLERKDVTLRSCCKDFMFCSKELRRTCIGHQKLNLI